MPRKKKEGTEEAEEAEEETTEEAEEAEEETTEEAEEETTEESKDEFKGKREFREKPQDTDREMFKIKCSECGKDAEVPFKPDGNRPVYCKDCFAKRRPRQNFRKFRRF